jgi:CheY-like chemotaxis protein
LRVLHIDPDKAVRADLAAELEASGHGVDSAETLADALARDSARRADLVVTETRLADGGVLDLLRRLHLARGGALPPIAVLAAEPEPGLAELCARAGVRRFLRKADDWPVNAAELHGLLLELEPPRRPAAAGPSRGTTPAPARVFRGSLDSVDLVEVVQLLNLGRKSGTLLLFGGTREGRLHLREGDVTAAACGAATGAEAFRALLGARGGSFRFEVGEAPVTRTIHEPTGSLLLDALRCEDEEGRASAEALFADPPDLGTPEPARAGFAPEDDRPDEIRLDDPVAPASSADGDGDGAAGGPVHPAAFDPVAALYPDPFADTAPSTFTGAAAIPPATAIPPALSAPPAAARPPAAVPPPAASPPVEHPSPAMPGGPGVAAMVTSWLPAEPPQPAEPVAAPSARSAGTARRSAAPVRELRFLPEPRGGLRSLRPAASARAWLVAGGAAAALAAGYAVHTAGARSAAEAPEARVEDVQALLLEAAEDQARIDSLEALVKDLLEASRHAADARR